MKTDPPEFTLQHLGDGKCRVVYMWRGGDRQVHHSFVNLTWNTLQTLDIAHSEYHQKCVKSEKKCRAWIDRHTVVSGSDAAHKRAAAWIRKWKLIVRILNRVRWI